VFGAPDVAGPAGFGVISDFGAEPKVFLPGEAVVSLAWSPSGREIAFTENDGRSDSVWLIDLRTRRTRRLHDGYFPSWSPDGKRLVFVRGTLPGGSIWVMNRDGSHLRLLLRGSSD
jgi:TolB protein